MKIPWKNLNSMWILLFLLACLNGKTEGIVGGEVAIPDQFKYQVSVQIQRQHVCGGGIISDFFILSAAHCVLNEKHMFVDKLEYSIVAGTNNLKSKTAPGFRVIVEIIYVLADYTPVLLSKYYRKSDLSVLKLINKLGVGSNPSVNILQLASGDTAKLYENKKPVIAGFGYEGVQIQSSITGREMKEVATKVLNRLKFTETSILSKTTCVRRYDSQVTEANVFCAQMKQNNIYASEGICVGDSGSVLVVDENIAIGVAIASPSGCDEQFFPGVYANITSHVPFINDIIQGRQSSKFVTLRPYIQKSKTDRKIIVIKNKSSS